MPTFQILGIHFDVSESTANNIFHYWINILQELLPCSLLEQFREKEDKNSCIHKFLTEQELIVDSTEQDIYRPEDDDKPKKYDYGKKKSHDYKNQIITTKKGREIVDVIVGKRGPESDVNLLIKQQKKFDKKQKFQGDKGYQGGVKNYDTTKKA